MKNEQVDRDRLVQEVAGLRKRGRFSITVLTDGLHVHYSDDTVRESAARLGISTQVFWEKLAPMLEAVAATVVQRVVPYVGPSYRRPKRRLSPHERELATSLDLQDIETKCRLMWRAQGSVYLGGEVVIEQRMYEDGSSTRTALLSIGCSGESGGARTVNLSLTLSDLRDLQQLLDEALARLQVADSSREVAADADGGDQPQ